jgi:hypothetical protein
VARSAGATVVSPFFNHFFFLAALAGLEANNLFNANRLSSAEKNLGRRI